MISSCRHFREKGEHGAVGDVRFGQGLLIGNALPRFPVVEPVGDGLSVLIRGETQSAGDRRNQTVHGHIDGQLNLDFRSPEVIDQGDLNSRHRFNLDFAAYE
jgi:hypothetical protein